MEQVVKGVGLLALVIASGITQAGAGSGNLPPQWEYRVLSEMQVIDLAKKDLAAGLNKLGDEGWELAAVKDSYIFKRPKSHKQPGDIERQVARLSADVEMWKDRAAWSARMAKKGFLSQVQADSAQAALAQAEMTLERVRKALPAEQKKPREKETAK